MPTEEQIEDWSCTLRRNLPVGTEISWYVWKFGTLYQDTLSKKSSLWPLIHPQRTCPEKPIIESIVPHSGVGFEQTFSLTLSDPSGGQDIASSHVLLNSGLTGVNGCWFYFDRAGNYLTLASDDIKTWSAPAKIGSSVTLQNSQCSISLAQVSMSSSGNTLTFNVPVLFTSTFAGTKDIYVWVKDMAGNSVDYQKKGTWTVPTP